MADEPWKDFQTKERGPWDDFKGEGPWSDFQEKPWEEFQSGPVDTNPDRFNSEIGPAPEQSMLKRAGKVVREALTPLIGPTEEEVSTHGVYRDGKLVYKPAGSAIDSE